MSEYNWDAFGVAHTTGSEREECAATFERMAPDERQEMLRPYCLHCFEPHPADGCCQCWNDE